MFIQSEHVFEMQAWFNLIADGLFICTDAPGFPASLQSVNLRVVSIASDILRLARHVVGAPPGDDAGVYMVR